VKDKFLNVTDYHIVDLSHTFFPGIPHAEDMPEESTKKIYDFEKDGFQAHYYGFAGQWGTHVDVPIHFVEGGRTLDQILPSELVLPLVVIDCVAESESDSDYLMSPEKVLEHESAYGRVPSGAFVAMKTGWSSRWPDPQRMSNKDSSGVAHFPGWSVEAAQLLLKERKVLAFGHEPTDTDGGMKVTADNFECEDYILRQNVYQVELMASMSEIPPVGSTIVVGFPKSLGGSGFPARLLALVPKL
jgi:kynurenine formamidase